MTRVPFLRLTCLARDSIYTTKPYDVLAFIGRFQPFHLGHKSVVDQALMQAKKVAIVLGSDQQPRTARNPFTTAERVEMITAVYPDEVAEGRIHFCPQVDHVYNMQRWIGGVQGSVMKVANTPFTPDPVRTGLIGHSKDHSSFYLKAFPTWDAVEVGNFNNINATDIRARFLEDSDWQNTHGDLVPEEVRHWLYTFEQGDDFDAVEAEHKFVEDYKRQWACAPYPPVFYTADAIVVQSGHILLVKRGAMPGRGLWALPGGFVNRYETSRQAAVRELKEETKIDLRPDFLDRSINSWRVFEDPYRSQRGRTVTTAYKIELRNGENLPKIKGSDDAEKAKWVPIANLKREAMFEDHYDIVETMVSI